MGTHGAAPHVDDDGRPITVRTWQEFWDFAGKVNHGPDPCDEAWCSRRLRECIDPACGGSLSVRVLANSPTVAIVCMKCRGVCLALHVERG